MSKPPKIDRKELNRPDEFVQQGTHILELVVGHQTKIVAALVIAGAVALGLYFYNWNKDSKNEQGWKEYAEVLKVPESERWEKFKKLSDKYSSVTSGQFVAVQLADHFFDEAKKNAEKDPKATTANSELAVEWYTKALKDSNLSPNEKSLLLINRGASQELAQKWDQAMNDYTESSKLGLEGKPLALLSQARIYEIKKETAKAIETYEKVAADFLNTDYGKTAKNYLRRLKSPLYIGESKS